MSSEYPEHEKLKAIQDQSQACYDFIEWLGSEKNVFLGAYETVTEQCQQCGHVEPHPWGEGCEGERAGGLRCLCAHAYHGNPERMHQWLPTSLRDLLSEHFGIDQKILEQEKQAMLDELRKLNAEPVASRGSA